MTVLQRRLFWRIYLTLLVSLVAVTVLMSALLWVLGPTMQERWGAFRLHVNNELVPVSDNPPGAVAAAVKRLGDEIGADISVYRSDGTLIAAHGRPVLLREPLGTREPRHMLRIDLQDGRIVMARLRPPVTNGLRILMMLAVVATAVGLAALPVTARLTRRLEMLRSGMERWGRGETAIRLDEGGSDEVAHVARTFNRAAERLDALLVSQRALLANASHELRSPVARLRLAIELWAHEPAAATRAEIVRNLGEIDQLVEEILLSSRLDHPSAFVGRSDQVDLLGLAAEEAVRVDAGFDGEAVEIAGNAILLRRLFRNLLENAARHGEPPVHVQVSVAGAEARITITDSGPGIPEAERVRIFEPFYRPAGRSEESGGWGLGLALVRQIAVHHEGRVACDAPPGGGCRFTVHLACAASASTALPPGSRDRGRAVAPFARPPLPRQDRSVSLS